MYRYALIAFAVLGACIGCSSSPEPETATTSPTTGSPGGSTTSGTTAVAYAEIQAIFDKSCVGCHGANAPKAGIGLANHEALMKGGDGVAVVSPGDPAGSVLVQALRGTNGKKLMPMGASPLAEDDIKKIEAWIKDGAKG